MKYFSYYLAATALALLAIDNWIDGCERGHRKLPVEMKPMPPEHKHQYPIAALDASQHMSVDEFWRIIDATRAPEQETQLASLKEELTPLSREQLLAFYQIYYALQEQSYNWRIGAAAEIINHGLTDDGFAYFLDWLIAQGRTVFERAHFDPETLAELDFDNRSAFAEFEDFHFAVIELFQQRYGEDVRDVTGLMTYPTDGPDMPAGEEPASADLPELYPKLWERYR